MVLRRSSRILWSRGPYEASRSPGVQHRDGVLNHTRTAVYLRPYMAIQKHRSSAKFFSLLQNQFLYRRLAARVDCV
ncbi:hypothetical protein LENED_006269 [Lentinula edodes]|uniref:Uncharacterized protein n=1 Tax=Lentinula edodes TaxID=5353 RepID=A0A1Q3EB68_LENED|nr:hypothetical protein LENED_006269 [Lentinula edodes]